MKASLWVHYRTKRYIGAMPFYLKSARQHLGTGSLVSQHLLQLFDLPSGLVVDDKGLAADRVAKLHLSVAKAPF